MSKVIDDEKPNWHLTLTTLMDGNSCGLMLSPNDTRKLAEEYLALEESQQRDKVLIRELVERIASYLSEEENFTSNPEPYNVVAYEQISELLNDVIQAAQQRLSEEK